MRKTGVPPERPHDAPSIDYGNRHPFDPKHQNGLKRQKRRLITQLNSISNYEPIRVGFDTTALEAQFFSAASSQSYDTATQLYLILKQILPQTAAIWKDVLRVIPIQGSITPLGQSSSSSSQQANYFCPSEFTSSTPGGVDVWIFVTANHYCGLSTGEGSSLAYAVGCERDQFDRPVTGAIDFCLQNLGLVTPYNDTSVLQLMYAANATTRHYHNMSIALNWTAGSLPILEPGDPNYAIVESGVQVTLHETSRALGLTSQSLPYFRNALTGVPLTPRPFALQEETCTNGNTQLMQGVASTNVLGRTVLHSGEVLFEVITPLVRQVVRNQFACLTLNGARLQNVLNSSDCYGSYWDERWFYQDLMTPFLSTTQNLLTPLTLAFFEDSSWYRANYQSAFVQSPSYGNLAGCDFVEKNCIVDGAVPDDGLGSFCNSTMTVDSNGFVLQLALPQTCDPTHTFKASCDLQDVQPGQDVPAVLQDYYQAGSLKIPKDFTQVDYCPVASYQV
jgi:leishmanolysin-like peptidase